MALSAAHGINAWPSRVAESTTRPAACVTGDVGDGIGPVEIDHSNDVSNVNDVNDVGDDTGASCSSDRKCSRGRACQAGVAREGVYLCRAAAVPGEPGDTAWAAWSGHSRARE